MEIWKDIKGFEGKYQVSSEGRIKSFVRKCEHILHQTNTRGYKRVSLSKDGKQIFKQVHRLVAEAFIPNPNNKPQVDHIIPISNGGTNDVSNLRWVTAQENNLNPITKEKHIGKLVNRKDQSIMVEQYTKSGELVKTYNSISETRNYGFSFQCVSKCVSGERKTHKGYIWVAKQNDK